MKPTYGAVCRYGLVAFASSLDQIGPLTRSVYDCALLLQHIVGRDPHDSTSVELPEPIALPTAERLDGLRVGVPAEYLGGGHRAGRARALRRDARAHRGAGRHLRRDQPAAHRVRAAGLLHHRPGRGVAPTWRASTACATATAAADPDDLLDMYERTRGEGFGAEVKRRIMLGTYALSAGYYDAYYGQAQKVRTLIARDFDAAFAERRPHRLAHLAHRRLQGRRRAPTTRWPCT